MTVSEVEKQARGDIESSNPDYSALKLPEDFAQFPEYSDLVNRWQWFQEQKIGILIHWGLYSQAGIVESWELSDKDTWARRPHPWRSNMAQLKQDYWGLAHVFNPTRYDPIKWAHVFRQAGVRYAIFTTKHHDGFNMFDTQQSGFKITNPKFPFSTNPNADVFGAFAKAMRQSGISVGAYYSKADWYNADYWSKDNEPKSRGASFDVHKQPERWQRYVDFVHAQLTELAENYGPLRMLWLDAGWVGDKREPLYWERLMPSLWKMQPQMLTVDRTMGGRFEEYVTPERQIPTLADCPSLPWESNLPLADNWGYVPHDHYKSLHTIVESILQVISLGGNIILGVGPKPDGTLPHQAIHLLQGLGAWTTLNSEGIYGTRPATPNIIRAAAQLGYFITENDDAYYLFPRKHMPNVWLDLERLALPRASKKVTRLGYRSTPYPTYGNVVRLSGSLQQSLYPGLKIAKSAERN